MNALFLNYKNYTVYNALLWGNCYDHYHAARNSGTYLQSFFHGSVAFCEFLPVVGQVVSLFELTVASALKPNQIIKRSLKRAPPEEGNLERRYLSATPTPEKNELIVEFPDKIETIPSALFPLQSEIGKIYKDLPWPKNIQKIVVLTEVRGGRGDITAAAKVIQLMQESNPNFEFDWICEDLKDFAQLFNFKDLSKIQIRDWSSSSSTSTPGDFLVVGPVKFTCDIDDIESRIHRQIAGPTFGFIEIAASLNPRMPLFLERTAKQSSSSSSDTKSYEQVHFLAFPPHSSNNWGLFPMGLQRGSGVFLDSSRINASLSCGYCCPSYLTQIKNTQLRRDVLEAMNVFDQSIPDYSQFSFNSGYAHRPASWGKFIDCVAMHEKNKHVVIVLNQSGVSDHLSTHEFKNVIFTPQRLKFLKSKGYQGITLKGEDQSEMIISIQEENSPSSRTLSVIIRPSFSPDDMKQIQLASERLLATGDNSALEAWCSRCKLYLYEDVDNHGCKWRFLQQQVDLATKFSPNLSKLLALFGGDHRLTERMINQPLNIEKMAELEQILSDPQISEATLTFCDHIANNYSFQPILEGALKRAAWHHHIPQLIQIEAAGLDEEFKSNMITFLKTPQRAKKAVIIHQLEQIKIKIHEMVQSHLASSRALI